MTGRTHDLFAFTALVAVFLFAPITIPSMTFGTLVVAIATNMIGGLAPDLDQQTAELWRKIRGGHILAKLISPLLGGHRLLSHSILGLFLASFLMNKILSVSSSFLIVDQRVVWWSFMIGFVSHLIADMITKEGIPLFFPIPIAVGIPPIKALRIKGGGFVEKWLIYPGLLFLNGYFFYQYHSQFIDFFRHSLS